MNVRDDDLEVLTLMGIRSGSKGCKDKNIQPILDLPLFTWALSAAKKSRYITRIMVSTDSEEYRELVQSYGIEAPFLRPAELATDRSLEIHYILHALDFLREKEGYEPDLIVRLLATVPMQQHYEIDDSIQFLLNNDSYDSSVVVSETRQHPKKALRIAENGQDLILLPYEGDDLSKMNPSDRGAYEKSFHRSNVVVFRKKTIQDSGTMIGNKCYPVIIEQSRAVDIDISEDFRYAEFLMKESDWERSYPNVFGMHNI